MFLVGIDMFGRNTTNTYDSNLNCIQIRLPLSFLYTLSF